MDSSELAARVKQNGGLTTMSDQEMVSCSRCSIIATERPDWGMRCVLCDDWGGRVPAGLAVEYVLFNSDPVFKLDRTSELCALKIRWQNNE